jgi:hypothetical protein
MEAKISKHAAYGCVDVEFTENSFQSDAFAALMPVYPTDVLARRVAQRELKLSQI